ncbi:GntR family transcriptional regulator [Streptomyces buecherae]|uniref:GntR family transcriptional regulator n=1 Tax=Streptomyces buecherae TaxID=2763006 RepID=UPI0036683E82
MPEPKYRQIADELRMQITRGDIPPGGKLPTEAELGKEHGVSRGTVRLALGALTNEGLIEGTAGRGTFVREHVVLTYYASRSEQVGGQPAGESDSYMTDVKSAGREGSQDFELRMERASSGVAERLRVEEGDTVVLRRLLRYLDGKPWSIQATYYPMRVAQGTPIMEPQDIKEGTTRWLANNGLEQVGFRDEMTTRMPTPEEVSALRMGTGVPVLAHIRTGYTATEPVRVTETIFPGDRHRVLYELGDLSALEGQARP